MASAVSRQDQLFFENTDYPSTRTPTHEPLLTITEACGVFNVKAHVLRRAIKIGLIPAYCFGNRRIRLRASDIDEAIQKSIR
jgi:excisionase family DNA binding protein